MSAPNCPIEVLLAEIETERSREAEALGGHVFFYSARGPGKTRPNEDACIMIDLGEMRGLLAVADGLGGQPGADLAAAQLVEHLSRVGTHFQSGEARLADLIQTAVEDANQAVVDLGMGGGTTLAMVTVSESEVCPYHVGDSMIYLADRDGALRFQVIPHSPIGYAVEAGLITEEEALHHPDRHIISNMIGTSELRLEIGKPLPFGPADTLLIASDGLTDNMRTEEIRQILMLPSAYEVGEALVDLGKRRMSGKDDSLPGKRDDMTLIVFRR